MSTLTPAPTVRLTADTSDFDAVLSELSELALDAPREVVERLVHLAQTPGEMVRVDLDRDAATAADEVRVRLQPSDRLMVLVTALRARDWNACIAVDESSGHGSAPPSVEKMGSDPKMVRPMDRINDDDGEEVVR